MNFTKFLRTPFLMEVLRWPLQEFFFYLGFLSQTFTNYRTAGEGRGHFFNSSSLPPASHTHLDISRAITAGSSPLHIASSRTRTGNLWLSSASHEPLDFFERNISCNFGKCFINCNILSTLKFVLKVNLNYWLHYNNLIKYDTSLFYRIHPSDCYLLYVLEGLNIKP